MARRAAKTKILLNVYDLTPHNKHLHTFGLGAYHTGVEINGCGLCSAFISPSSDGHFFD
jgi:hypothetical protein